MIGDLFINGADMHFKGVSIGDNFLNAISGASPSKSGIENKSPLEHGKRSIPSRKVDEREVTLVFYIEGNTEDEFRRFKSDFYSILYDGTLLVKVPKNGDEVYHLEYKNQTSYAQNTERTFCKIAVKFCEPNPMNRK